MSQENVEVVRRAYDAWHRDGIEGVMPFLHEDIEWRNPEDSPIAGVFRGKQGVRDWLAQVSDVFGEMRFTPDEFREVSEDRVLVLLRFGFTASGSALEMEIPFAHVIDLTEGRATALRMYSDPAKALEAVGLRE
jgi:ketosteroid isomerase-like protein